MVASNLSTAQAKVRIFISMLQDLSKMYFQLFEKKDLYKISEMLSENVTLKDWSFSCIGKESVVNAFQNIFNTVNSIEIKIINIFTDKSVVISELNIITENNISESVVDIITFDKNSKIISIKAFKC